MHHSMDRTFLLGAHAPVDSDCRSAFLRRLGALVDPAATAARVVPEPDLSLR